MKTRSALIAKVAVALSVIAGLMVTADAAAYPPCEACASLTFSTENRLSYDFARSPENGPCCLFRRRPVIRPAGSAWMALAVP
jgi:hypothetical protein